jgi:hydroxymethylpyrimidine pyrophosphatase-like HAD family hydrolase
MWYFRAVAFDLDGTLAMDDRVAPEVLAAIDAARADRAVLLVTGRIHAELERTFPGLESHFDAVVTENGAVLRTPLGTRCLGEPVDPALADALAERGIAVRRGEVLLAIDGRDGPATTELITELGFDHQVVRNRGAAMVLPAGVTKGLGLSMALDQLGLSAHSTIGVGDAENDLSLLRTAEVGAAVADAVPSLATRADLVLDRPDGAGVVSLLGGPLLRGHERLGPPRRWVQVGWYDDGSPARLPGSQSSLLITGETGAGKSYFAGLLAEQWIDAGYSVLVVDPEGDHVGLAERAGVHLVDAGAHLPGVRDLLGLLRPRHASLVLDLSGLDVDDQLAYLRRLPEAVAAARARYGIPHWIVYDEAQQQAWIEDSGSGVSELGSALVTWQPQLLSDDDRRSIEFTIHITAPSAQAPSSRPLSGTLSASGKARPFQVGTRTSPHVRHWHKYATVSLPPHRQFYFHDPARGGRGTAAATLQEFSRHVRHCDLGSLDYHLFRGDFSRWVAGTLSDESLGSELAGIERDVEKRRAASLERAREQVCDAVDRRYHTG